MNLQKVMVSRDFNQNLEAIFFMICFLQLLNKTRLGLV
jgi:hypothetical protein